MKRISENDFEKEEFDDEDFAEIDGIIEILRNLPRREVNVINLPRINQFRFAAAMIQKVLRETGCSAKVECETAEFNHVAGAIRVEGDTIDILNIEGFLRVGEFANNVEVYPLINGKVRMAYMFYKLMISPEEAAERFSC